MCSGGEEGEPGFVARNQLPHFGNHSFPAVSLPFRPAQTDNLRPPHGPLGPLRTTHWSLGDQSDSRSLLHS